MKPQYLVTLTVLFCAILAVGIYGCKKEEPVRENSVSKESKQQEPPQKNTIKQETDTVTADVANSNGSVSQVKLKKQGVGYVGPRGEYYDHLPTPEELKPVYGF